MAGKKYRGKLCAYCGTVIADTDEHVFSRQLFLEASRANLPKAPACRGCNGEKATLEHYLTAIAPFGGRHADATENLTNMVPKRLAKNQKLHRELAAGQTSVWTSSNSGLVTKALALPFDGVKLERFFAFAVRGLYWHHWATILPADSLVHPMCLTRAGERVIDGLLKSNAAARALANLGNGTVEYEGAQGLDRPDVSVWKFRIYGGLVLSGDPSAPGEETSSIGVLTAPKRVALSAKWRAGDGGLSLDSLFTATTTQSD